MIDWLFDRIWAWKNHDALVQLDAQQDFLRSEGERLGRRMVEMFGPDWESEAERRLSKALMGRYTVT